MSRADERLEPGRELDALVAEKVMGVPVDRGVECAYECGFADDDIGIAESRLDHDGWVTYDPVPHYSTDISAAWEVVEKMCDMGRNPEIQWAESVSGESFWFVTLVNPADIEVHADTAPHAICLAALRAVGSTRETP